VLCCVVLCCVVIVAAVIVMIWVTRIVSTRCFMMIQTSVETLETTRLAVRDYQMVVQQHQLQYNEMLQRVHIREPTHIGMDSV
jgi:hypothetical protein